MTPSKIRYQPPPMTDVLHHIDSRSPSPPPSPSLSSSTSVPSVSGPFTSFQPLEPLDGSASLRPQQLEDSDTEQLRRDVLQLIRSHPDPLSLVPGLGGEPSAAAPVVKSPGSSAPRRTGDTSGQPASSNHFNYQNPPGGGSRRGAATSKLPDHKKPSGPDIKIRQSLNSATTTSSSTSSPGRGSVIEPSRKRGGSLNTEAAPDKKQTLQTDETAALSRPAPKKKRFFLPPSSTETRNRAKKPQSKAKPAVSKKKTSFSSFPYRDSMVGGVRSSDKSEKVAEKVSRPKKKLVSLEDKQDSRTETLQRLLDIAGAGWVAQNTGPRGRGSGRPWWQPMPGCSRTNQPTGALRGAGWGRSRAARRN